MVTTSPYLEAPRRLRAFVRAHETSLVVLAALVGTVGGLVVAAMSAAVEGLHVLLFNLQVGERLSSQLKIEPLRALLVPSLGGLLLGMTFLLLLRWRPAREIDPIEANALHGGRMSFRGSVIVALQTVWSSGVGASVGLEAGYTQLASGLGASLGRGFRKSSINIGIPGSCSSNTWFLPGNAMNRAFGIPAAISRPDATGTRRSSRTCMTRVDALTCARRCRTSNSATVSRYRTADSGEALTR